MSSHLKQNRVVSIHQLVAHPDNYRAHPEEQIRNLKASLVRFGQGRSIVVQDGPEGLLIVAGHGIVEAARLLGWEELRADILPADWLPEQVRGYLVADNQHVALAEDDQDVLTRLLQGQQEAGYDLATVGADDEMLRQMLREAEDGEQSVVRVLEPGVDLGIAKNQKESLEAYNQNAIRQIVLLMSIPDFAYMLARFRQVRSLSDELETNTDVVRFLTEYFVTHESLPPVSEPMEVTEDEDDLVMVGAESE